MHDTSDMARAAAVSAEPRADAPAPRRAPTNPRRVSPWADAAVLEAAITRYRQGRSAAQVAAALWDDHQVRVTRNAVIGLMHRLGVKGGGGLDGPGGVAGARPSTRRQPSRPAGRPAPRPQWRPRWTPPAWRLSAEPPPGGGVPYFEASEAQCPFPLWDEATPMFERRVCGGPRCEPNARINHYCAHHARLCFVPRGERPVSNQTMARDATDTAVS
jgi:hypothetical protein